MSSLFFTAYPSELKRFERDLRPPCGLHWAILEILDDSTLRKFGEREQTLTGWEVDTGTQSKPLKAFASRLAALPENELLSVETRKEGGKIFLKFTSRRLQKAKANAERRKAQRSKKRGFRPESNITPEAGKDSSTELNFPPEDSESAASAIWADEPLFPENRKENSTR